MSKNNDKLEKLALEIVNLSHLPDEDFVCKVLEKANKILDARKCLNCKYFSLVTNKCDWIFYCDRNPIWLSPDIIGPHEIIESVRNEETGCKAWEKM